MRDSGMNKTNPEVIGAVVWKGVVTSKGHQETLKWHVCSAWTRPVKSS